MKIVRAERIKERAPVFDIEIDDGHHYILDNGVISHNSGGGGFKYACSTIITMTKAQDKDGDEIKGSIVTCTAYKSRLTREKLKIKTRILHKGGLDRYYGLLPLAEEIGLVKKISNKFEFVDTGDKAFEKAINNNGEKWWTPERLAKIEEHVQTKFKYGSGIESETDDDEPAED